jgi:hypothetical protein
LDFNQNNEEESKVAKVDSAADMGGMIGADDNHKMT